MTAPLPHFGIRLDGSMSPGECVARATAADEAGLSAIWFAENAFARGTLPVATACALATRRIGIIAGVFNPFARHPTMMAMEIGSLDELSGGRTGISIGAGIGSAVEKLGGSAGKPLTALKDTHHILSRMLAGDAVDFRGELFSANGVKLNHPPRRRVPIYIAGRGDRTLAFCGEVADGLIVSNMTSLAHAGRASTMVADAWAGAGRSGRPHVVQFLPAAVRRDRGAALDIAKRAVAALLPNFWSLGERVPSARSALVMGTGIEEDEFAHAAARLSEGEDPTRSVSEPLALAFAIAGTPDDFIEQASAHARHGISELALTFTGPEPEIDTRLLADAAGLAGSASKGPSPPVPPKKRQQRTDTKG